MEAIITAATVLSMYLTSANSNGGRHMYNADLEDQRVNRIEVFDNTGAYLSQKLQYRFLYDSQNRLVSKEALKWNADRQEWQPYYLLHFRYDMARYTVERQEWDAKDTAYAPVREMMVYSDLGEGITAVDTYRWDNSLGDMARTDGTLVIGHLESILADNWLSL